MTQYEEELQRNYRSMTTDELLDRFNSGNLTEAAMAIALAEVRLRGVDPKNPDSVTSYEKEQITNGNLSNDTSVKTESSSNSTIFRYVGWGAFLLAEIMLPKTISGAAIAAALFLAFALWVSSASKITKGRIILIAGLGLLIYSLSLALYPRIDTWLGISKPAADQKLLAKAASNFQQLGESLKANGTVSADSGRLVPQGKAYEPRSHKEALAYIFDQMALVANDRYKKVLASNERIERAERRLPTMLTAKTLVSAEGISHSSSLLEEFGKAIEERDRLWKSFADQNRSFILSSGMPDGDRVAYLEGYDASWEKGATLLRELTTIQKRIIGNYSNILMLAQDDVGKWTFRDDDHVFSNRQTLTAFRNYLDKNEQDIDEEVRITALLTKYQQEIQQRGGKSLQKLQ